MADKKTSGNGNGNGSSSHEYINEAGIGNADDEDYCKKVIKGHCRWYTNFSYTKDQIISEQICGVLNFPKKQRNYCKDSCPSH